jgi:hypothetical protein
MKNESRGNEKNCKADIAGLCRFIGWHTVGLIPKNSSSFLFGYGLSYTSFAIGDCRDLEINVADLAFYDETKRSWNVESGDFVLHFGNSSRNISKSVKILVK